MGAPPLHVRPWAMPWEHLGVLLLQGHRQLLVWPRSHVAMVRQEHFGRVEVVSAQGELAHSPAAIAGPPLVPASPGVLVNPALVEVRGDRVVAPGGWEAPLTEALVGAPPEPPLPGAEVLYVEASPGSAKGSRWHTDAGVVESKLSSPQAARRIPGMLKAGTIYVNARRLRRIVSQHEPQRLHLWLDDGRQLTVGWYAAQRVRAKLDLDSYRWLPPATEGQAHLSAEELRRWPWDLLMATGEQLRPEFRGDPERLIANIAWQRVERVRAGVEDLYGTSHRDLYYWVRTRLRAAGAPLGRFHAQPESLQRYLRYCNVLARLVMDRRLCTFREMGFVDRRPDLRGLGTTRPDVVLFVEKATTARVAARVCEELGLSWVIAGGMSRIVGTEWLAELLRPVVAGPVLVLAFVDYDPWGWAAGEAFPRQLERFRIGVRGLRFLVEPSRFTPEQRRELSVPLPQPDEARRSYVERWVGESGGVDGEARGLSADLFTEEMLRGAVVEALQRAG